MRCYFTILSCIFLVASLLMLSSCRNDVGQGVEASAPAIQNKGSDTIVNLALAWAERYQALNPAVGIAVTGGGSGTGIAALINGTVDIANASRSIKDKEIESAKDNGVEPVQHVIARDAIAIIVPISRWLEMIGGTIRIVFYPFCRLINTLL